MVVAAQIGRLNKAAAVDFRVHAADCFVIFGRMAIRGIYVAFSATSPFLSMWRLE
jgi:hypothetical protein